MSSAAPLQNTATQPQAVFNSKPSGLLLQRKCACGTPTSSLTGSCPECQRKKKIQTKLTIGASNDPLEQKADRLAEQVLATPAKPSASGAVPRSQRCAVQSSGQNDTIPTSVGNVLASSGRPLEPAIQQDMGQRFSHDFSRVRVHTGAAAEQSARDVNAHAYTLDSHIVFGDGEYSPHAGRGRELLAHELAHVVQSAGSSGVVAARGIDGGSGDPLEREADRAAFDVIADRPPQIHGHTAGGRLHRQVIVDEPAGGCGTCLPATLVGSQVHDLIQATFPLTYQNEARFTIPSSGGDAILDLLHITLSPGSPPSTIEVGEIKPNNVEGIKDGAKDLLFYIGELRARFPSPWWEVVPMLLPPPLIATPFHDGFSPLCPAQGVSVINSGGLYLYSCAPPRSTIPSTCCYPPPIPVPKPETKKVDEKEKKPIEPPFGAPVPVPVAARDLAVILAALAAGAALVAKFGGKRVLAPLMAMAAIVLLANGAEASVGLEGDDALEALLKLSDAKGQPIPDDIKDALRKDPEMRKLLTDAVKSGDYSAAQQQAGEAVTRTILANRDAFSQEELEILLKATEGNKGSLPQGEITVEELKRQIELKKMGAGSGSSPGAGGAGSGGPGVKKEDAGGGKTNQAEQTDYPKPPPPVMTPEERLVEGMASKEADGPKFTAALKAKLLAAAREAVPPLADKEVDELLKRLGSAAGKSEDEIVESLRKGVITLRKSKGEEAVPATPEPGEESKKPKEPPGKAATDDVVNKAKQGKKDPKVDAILEEKLGWINAGDTYITASGDIVFQDGKSFSGNVIGRDNAGNLFFGSGPITPRLVSGSWRLEVSAGIKLKGAAGQYGTTKKFSMPALAGAGIGKKEKAMAQ